MMGACAQPSRLGCLAAVLCLLSCMAVDAVEQVRARRAPTIHTVVPTECSTYFTWQVASLAAGVMHAVCYLWALQPHVGLVPTGLSAFRRPAFHVAEVLA